MIYLSKPTLVKDDGLHCLCSSISLATLQMLAGASEKHWTWLKFQARDIKKATAQGTGHLSSHNFPQLQNMTDAL